MLWDSSPMMTIIVSPGFHNVGVCVGVVLKDILNVGKCWRKTLFIFFWMPFLNMLMFISWKHTMSILYFSINTKSACSLDNVLWNKIMLALTPHIHKLLCSWVIGETSFVGIFLFIFFFLVGVEFECCVLINLFLMGSAMIFVIWYSSCL